MLFGGIYNAGTHVPGPGGEPAGRGAFWSGYLSFLGLFWMTAPLAWLYAIPYERLLSPERAVDANLATLAVVATWRVLLTIRIVSTCSQLPLRVVIGTVLAFSTLLAGVASVVHFLTNFSLMSLMSGPGPVDEPGYRGPPWLGWLVGLFVWGFFPLLALFMAMKVFKGRQAGWVPRHAATAGGPSHLLVALAGLALLVWVPLLPLTQPEQQRRKAFEAAVRVQDYEGAAALLDQPRDAFPPNRVPPQVSTAGFSRDFPDPGQIACTLEALHARGGPDWVIDLYARRLRRLLSRSISKPQLDRLVTCLPRCPEGSALLAEARGWPAGAVAEAWKHGDYEEAKRRSNTLFILAAIDGKAE